MAKSNNTDLALVVISTLCEFSGAFAPEVTKVIKSTQEERLLQVLGISQGYEGFTVTKTPEGFRCTVAREAYRAGPRDAQAFMNTVADRCRARYQDRMTVTRDGFVCVRLG